MSLPRLISKSRSLVSDVKSCRNTVGLLLSNHLHQDIGQDVKKTGGFTKYFQKFENLNNQSPQTFDGLLRYSPFINLGHPAGKVVIGRIFHIVEDDLYIDFGWKFHCVCPRPTKNRRKYLRGTQVKLRIKELELSSKFLGYENDLTLLEADCILLGLVQEESKTAKHIDI